MLLPCARCGHANPARAKFCAECGTALGAPQAIAAERRQLTVMFCDLVGSTELSARLDPEDLRDLIREHQAHCAEIVKQFDGSIVQYLGDGVLTYFGFPQAHEDDARRAGYAGLEIVRAMGRMSAHWAPKLGVELAVRVGIHTGPVVMGEVGAGDHTERLAIGETPNIAARLQSGARPNSVLASEATHRLVARSFECRDIGDRTFSGLPTPIHVYEIVAESDVAARQSIPQKGSSTLIGRQQEIGALLASWREAHAGMPHVNLVRGEAGIGKSHLVGTLKEHVVLDGGIVLEGQCSPYHQNSAFYAVTQLLARWLGFASADTAVVRRRRLESGLENLSLTDADAMPLLANLLSIPPDAAHDVRTLDAKLRRQRTLDVLDAIPYALARRRPVMLLVEDLHWADPSTLEFLNQCVLCREASRILITLTSRAEFGADWIGREGVTALDLTGLDAAQAEELVVRVTGGKALPPEMAHQIVQRAGGIPLFIEETTRAIVEAGVLRDAGDRYELVGSLPTAIVPMSLQDALMARLDRLGPAKHVVQLGATIGRDFSYELLQAVSTDDEPVLQQQLQRAVSSGLLQQHGALPQRTFVFKHSLVQDTAYQSLLRKTRQLYHQRIAEVLEERFHEIADERPELLAHHHTEAGDIAKAVPSWQKAGSHAIASAAFAEAINYLSGGLRLLETLPPSPERDRQEFALQSPLGMALQAHRGYASADVDRAYKRARILCSHGGDVAELVSVLRGQNLFYVVRADYHTAMDLGRQLLEAAADSRSPEHLLEGHLTLGLNLLYLGRFSESRTHFEQGLALRDSPDRPLQAFQYVGHSGAICRSYLGRTLSFLGYHDRALKFSQEGLALARTLSIPMSQAQALGMLANLYQTRRETGPAQHWVAETLTYATAHGFPYWTSLSSMVDGWLIAHHGQLDRGIDQLRGGLDRYLATGARLGLSWFLVMLAELYGMNRQWGEGFQALNRALSHVAQTGERYYEAELHRLKGDLLRLQNGSSASAAAETCFRQALDIARGQGAKSWELRAATSLARLWREEDRTDEARDLLAGVLDWFNEGFDTPDLQDSTRVLHELAYRAKREA